MKRGIAGLLAAVLIGTSGLMTACIQPKEDSGSYDRAVEALENGDYELAMSEFGSAAELDGRKAEGFRGQGIVYYEQESYEAAILMFDKSLNAIKYENKDFEQDLLLYKADAQTKNGNSDEALRIYENLEEGNKSDVVFALEGQIYLRRGNVDQAVKCFDAAVEKSQRIELFLMIYETYLEVNREGDGAAYLEKAIQIQPKTPEECAKLGTIYYYLEDYTNAAAQLNKAIEDGYTQAINVLGDIYLEQNDISGAKALFISALRQNIDIGMAYNGLTMCAIKEENYDSALTYVGMGLEDSNEEAKKSLLFNEIIVYEKMLDFETAKVKMTEYLKLYPADKKAKDEAKFILH